MTPIKIDFSTHDLKDRLCVVPIYEDGSFASTEACPFDSESQEWTSVRAQYSGGFEKGGVNVFLEGRPILLWTVAKAQTTYERRAQGGRLWDYIQSLRAEKIQICAWGEDFEEVLYGFHLKQWRFDTYKTRSKPADVCRDVVFYGKAAETLARSYEDNRPLIESIHWARQAANEPGNVLYPESFAKRMKEFQSLGVQVTVLNEQTLREKGFGALVGVGQGSCYAPCLVLLEWKGKPQDKPIVFVGKGVTFDSGGLSIKPSNSMEDMKMDMSGAAVVAGLIRAAAGAKLPVHIVGVLPLVENAVSSTAQRPGDIVKSLSGQTIEILNTDAEGRLILADALWYAQETYSPSYLIDVATLTGAARVALGSEYAGLFSTDETLSQDLIQAGQESGEKLWALPLCAGYDRALNTPNADIKNISAPGYGAGSSVAAQFLKRFVKEGQTWAHIDIASVDHVTWDDALCPKGGSAFGLQVLYRWLTGRVSST